MLSWYKHSLTVWCSRHYLTTLFGSLRWFSIQCFTSSCWSRFLAPQNGHTNVDRFGILLHIKGHTHTQIITRLGRRVCICVTVKLNMYRCSQSHRQLRCWKMCPTNLNLYLEKVTNVTFTQIHWELQTHSHYRSVITASQIRKAQLWVTHVHFGNTSLCDQTALVLQTAALLNKIEALWTLTAEQCVPLWDTPSWPLNHYHVPQHWVNTGSLCQLQLCYWL